MFARCSIRTELLIGRPLADPIRYKVEIGTKIVGETMMKRGYSRTKYRVALTHEALKDPVAARNRPFDCDPGLIAPASVLEAVRCATGFGPQKLWWRGSSMAFRRAGLEESNRRRQGDGKYCTEYVST